MKILLTGANGFIARALSAKLASTAHEVVQAVRKNPNPLQLEVGNIDSSTDWSESLQSIDVVIHTAARVHIMHEQTADPLAEFRAVNVEGTLNLARQAAQAGCKRFVYLSSIKVNGEATTNKPFTSDDEPNPEDSYGVSKYEAEQGLLDLVKNTQMDVVIIRPPLVYGPGVKANFRSLINVIGKGIPLPLANIKNKRSLVGLGNLINFIEVCMIHPKASNQIFLVSDGRDISTSELLAQIAAAYQVPLRLFYCPRVVLVLAANIFKKKAQLERLTQSLQIDIQKNQELLNWKPRHSMEKTLRMMAADNKRKRD